MQKYFKRSIIDRYDGWRVRNVDAVFNVIPFFLRTRVDSQNFFEENIPIEGIEAFIREHREDMPDMTLMHIVMAATVRMISQRPYLNRFVIWNKIYAHNDIRMSLMIKRKQSGEETMIKPEFDPSATLYDIVKTISNEVDLNITEGIRNSADNTSAGFGKLPPFIVRTVVWMFFKLDGIGLLPKKIHSTSPWHCSAFLTNVGSLGIGPIYHHLYEFGTCSMFIAMGNKHKIRMVGSDGTQTEKRFVGFKFVTDERICDGQYYAYSMRLLRRLLLNPELLLVPPEHVVVDDGIAKTRIDLPNPNGGK
ncbi:MAG: hypothetical protein RR232_07320 [Clostridia bacterium]